jgi:predicted nucleic acid-binding protein
MTDPLLFDTDVLIDFLRFQTDAVSYLNSRTERLLVSAITVAELYTGVRVGRETTELVALLGILEVISVDRDTAEMAGRFRQTYRKSHHLDITDALIAATAVREGATLVTLNRKHFPMIPNLIVPYAKP